MRLGWTINRLKSMGPAEISHRLVWRAELGGALFVFLFGIVLILANLYG